MKKINAVMLILFLTNGINITKAMFPSVKRLYPTATRSLPNSPAFSPQRRYYASSPRMPSSHQVSGSNVEPIGNSQLLLMPVQNTQPSLLSRFTSSLMAYFYPEATKKAQEEKEAVQKAAERAQKANIAVQQIKNREDLAQKLTNLEKRIMDRAETKEDISAVVNYTIIQAIVNLREIGKTPEEIKYLQPTDWNQVIMASPLNSATSNVLKQELRETLMATRCTRIEDIQKVYNAYYSVAVPLIPSIGNQDLKDLQNVGLDQPVKDIIHAFKQSIQFENVPNLSPEERLATSELVYRYFNTPPALRMSFVAQLPYKDKDKLMQAKERGINTDHQFKILSADADKKLQNYRKTAENKVRTIEDNFYQQLEKNVFKPRRDMKEAYDESERKRKSGY